MLETQLDSSSRQSGIDASPELQEVISKLLSEDRDPAPFPPERDPFSIEVCSAARIECFLPHKWHYWAFSADKCAATELKLQLLSNLGSGSSRIAISILSPIIELSSVFSEPEKALGSLEAVAES